MFERLEDINSWPEPFEFYTASDLWTDEHTSEQMLKLHLNEDIDICSRNTAFIDRSVEWMVSEFNIGVGTKIADFGCGPGLYTTRLAKIGAEVTGIDFSKRSIQYAEEVANREGLSIRYINQDYLEFETDERYHLAKGRRKGAGFRGHASRPVDALRCVVCGLARHLAGVASVTSLQIDNKSVAWHFLLPIQRLYTSLPLPRGSGSVKASASILPCRS